MSDNEYPPFDDEPTRAQPRYAGHVDPTRAVPTYDQGDWAYENRPAFTGDPEPEKRRGIAAQLVTVGLLCTLLGVGLGYLLFGGSGSDTTPETTTTTFLPSTTLTTSISTSTTAPTTTTTRRSTSTTSSTTTSTVTSSTRVPSLTVNPAD